MSSFLLKPQWSPRCWGLCLLAVAPFLLSLPALASGNGPSGANIGFDFNWNMGPNGYTASFIQSANGTGAALNNCGGQVSASSRGCDFAFSYDIGGVPQTPVAPGGTYDTWNGTCDSNPNDSAPLTLFNCFNANSFGQVFIAPATGTLSNFTMRMTCLNPLGGTINGLTALIYQTGASGTSIGATPLAQVPVDLSSCPTLTSWSGHTFSSSDFAPIPLNFSGVNVTAGNIYAVYFAGLVPGDTLPGGPPPVTNITTTPTPTPAPPTVWLVLIGISVMGLLTLWRRGQGSAPRFGDRST